MHFVHIQLNHRRCRAAFYSYCHLFRNKHKWWQRKSSVISTLDLSFISYLVNSEKQILNKKKSRGKSDLQPGMCTLFILATLCKPEIARCFPNCYMSYYCWAWNHWAEFLNILKSVDIPHSLQSHFNITPCHLPKEFLWNSRRGTGWVSREEEDYCWVWALRSQQLWVQQLWRIRDTSRRNPWCMNFYFFYMIFVGCQ